MPSAFAASSRPTGPSLERTNSWSRLRSGSSSVAMRWMSSRGPMASSLTPISVDKRFDASYITPIRIVFRKGLSMSTIALRRRESTATQRDWTDARFQAFAILWIGFSLAPVLFGLDKFFDVLVDWPKYLAPWVNDLAPGSASDFMYVVGAVEIVAGLSVAIKPRYGAYLVAAWLAGIIVNLLSYSGYYDVALRDFGLMLAALTLARPAVVHDRPGVR